MANLETRLHTFDSVPEGFLDTPVNELHRVLPGPSLIEVEGNMRPPLFVATLLHGNEPTGIAALQKLLKKYGPGGDPLPRSLLIFVGNVLAARENQRRFSWQPDYNRIWTGGDLPEHAMAGEVLRRLKRERVFACIDIHNTSGRNPHYACLNRLDAPFVHLARLYSPTLVYFTRPGEVLSLAMSDHCPAITIESGKPDDAYGVQHAFEFLEKCLKLDTVPDFPVHEEELYIYHSIARIHVPRKSRIGFNHAPDGLDFTFLEDIDGNNFAELPENSLLGWRHNERMRLTVLDENDRDVEGKYIEYQNGEIRLKRSVVPSMFTTNETIVHQDCLGYLMERFSFDPKNRN